MWLTVAVPLTVLFTVLIGIYLKKEPLMEKKTIKDKMMVLLPRHKLDFVFVIAMFAMGIFVFGLRYNYSHDYIEAPKLAILALLFIPIVYIDYKTKKIPNKLLILGLISRIVLYIIEVFVGEGNMLNIFLSDIKGALVGGLIFLMGSLFVKNGVGMGDIKMFALIGIFYGYGGTVSTIVYSLFLCFIMALFLLITRKKAIKDTVPLAPFAFIGLILTLILEIF